MKYFKNLLPLIFLLFTANNTYTKRMGAKATGKPESSITPSSSAKAVAQPKTYADALAYIKTQMSANDVLFKNDTLNPMFIDFVQSLNLSEIETKALLQAGVNIHTTWTGDNARDKSMLEIFKITIEATTNAIQSLINKPRPQPGLETRLATQIPTLPERPVVQPKKAISIQPQEQAIPTIKPIMPQQQLFAQKDALQNLVKNVWEGCLNELNKKYDGLISEHSQYENVIETSDGFEKQPKTDADILFIKNTVKSIIAKTQTSSIKFGQRVKETQEQALKSLLEGIVANALVESILKDSNKPLFWCKCHPEYKRLTLALLLVNDIRERFPNKNQQIVYTSFASGSLFLDYVVLSELLQSHTNILVNLIDLLYPDVPGLTKKDLRAKRPQELHKLQKKNAQEQADTIDSFQTKIAQVVSQKSDASNYNFDVNVYQNAYDYITYVQKNPKEKSNVLLLVDPDIGTFGMADFPALANVVNVWTDAEAKDEQAAPAFTIFLPRHHSAQLYEKKEKASPQIMQNLQNQLLSLIKTTDVNKNYTPKFTNALLENSMLNRKTMIEDLKMNISPEIRSTLQTDDVLKDNFPKLMEVRSKLKENASEIGYVDSDLLKPLTPIKLSNVPVLLSWGTDAHISFQDLVWDVLAPNAAVYELYKIDPTSEEESNIQIIKVNPEAYKKADVITPNSGKDLITMDEYKQSEDLMEKVVIK